MQSALPPALSVIRFSSPIVKEHAPSPAGAHSETGVEVQATQDSADKAAGGGCRDSACSASSFVVEVTPDWHHIPVDEKGRPIRDAK
jgi:hypothetical protein